MEFREFAGACEHYNRWKPTDYTLRTALARLVDHGLAVERDGRFFVAGDVAAEFESVRNPSWDTFDELDALIRLVVDSTHG